MTDLTITPRSAGAPEAAARCAQCTAMLAPDQLFCLSCGSRRRDARIPFRDVLATEAAPAFGAGGAGAGWGDGSAPMALPPGRMAPSTSYGLFLATFACLLLALGLGFWIGGKRQPTVAAAAPVVTAAVAPVASTPAVAETAPADTAATDDSSSSDSSSKDTPAVDPAAAGAAATKALDNLSPSDYQKKAAKLPSEVSTAGKPLPKDDKPAGGGSGFEEIK